MSTFKKTLPLIFLLIGLMTSSSGFSKPLASPEKMKQASDFFMQQIMKGEIEQAYSLISAYLGVDLQNFLDRGEKTAREIQQAQKKIGLPLSYALLKEENVGEHFYKYTYLLKYPSAALVWEVNYYQPDKGWNLVDVSFNGNINALFE